MRICGQLRICFQRESLSYRVLQSPRTLYRMSINADHCANKETSLLLFHYTFALKKGGELNEITSINHPSSRLLFLHISRLHSYSLPFCSTFLYVCVCVCVFHVVPLALTRFLPDGTGRTHFLSHGQLMAGLRPPYWMAFRRFTGRQLLQAAFRDSQFFP